VDELQRGNRNGTRRLTVVWMQQETCCITQADDTFEGTVMKEMPVCNGYNISREKDDYQGEKLVFLFILNTRRSGRQAGTDSEGRRQQWEANQEKDGTRAKVAKKRNERKKRKT
jgi:hypothetical protein